MSHDVYDFAVETVQHVYTATRIVLAIGKKSSPNRHGSAVRCGCPYALMAVGHRGIAPWSLGSTVILQSSHAAYSARACGTQRYQSLQQHAGSFYRSTVAESEPDMECVTQPGGGNDAK